LTSKSSHYQEFAPSAWRSQTEGDRRHFLQQCLQSCRRATLGLFEGEDPITFSKQAHEDFSPMGWHLGHIAFTEAYWILQHCAGLPAQFPEYHRLFAADGLPKTERQNLPTFAEICHYLDAVRIQVLHYLETATITQQERLWYWLLQHESQHSETITVVKQLLSLSQTPLLIQNQRCIFGASVASAPRSPAIKVGDTDMIEIPAGCFEMGDETIAAIDNERREHIVELKTYWIDRFPVTCWQYRQFMAAGGYQNSEWWSEAGWSWLQHYPVAKPLYWSDGSEWDDHPVCGVSWYEAEAYANFAGKRLPTESEWEKAAGGQLYLLHRYPYPWGYDLPTSRHCNHDHWVGHTTPVTAYSLNRSPYGCEDMLGNVWEWTTSWFKGYPGFRPYPYSGYSQAYFDQQHRVLRGGSWATRPWALRSSFRNWYHPNVRQIFVGFRCAYS